MSVHWETSKTATAEQCIEQTQKSIHNIEKQIFYLP